MKAKGLDIDMDNTLPKFVERTMEVPVDEEKTIELVKTSNILIDLEKSEEKEEENNRTNLQEVVINQEDENLEDNNEEDENLEDNNEEDENAKPLESPLVKEVNPETTELDLKTKTTQNDWKDKLLSSVKTNFEFFLEYFIGFVIGISLSLLGYKFVKYVNKKSRTRRGLYIGCLVSFVLIFFVCIFYMTYTRDVLLTQRSWKKHHRSLKRLNMPGFSIYLKYSMTNMGNGIISAMSSLVPKLSYSHRRRRRSSAKTRRKIKALRHMRTRIHRHLRVLL